MIDISRDRKSAGRRDLLEPYQHKLCTFNADGSR